MTHCVCNNILEVYHVHKGRSHDAGEMFLASIVIVQKAS